MLRPLQRAAARVPASAATAVMYLALAVGQLALRETGWYDAAVLGLWLVYLALLRRGHPEHVLYAALGAGGVLALAGVHGSFALLLAVGAIVSSAVYLTYDRPLQRDLAPAADELRD